MNERATTPLMKQYASIKDQFQNALVLFQVGDFYELFFDDAKTAASVLNIALTKRGNVNGEPIALAGIPIHAKNAYLAKLIKAGYHVVIVDQLSDPVPGTIVERGVTSILTPGTLTDACLLDEKSASYLFSFYPDDQNWGLLFAELLTGKLFATQIPAGQFKQLESELVRFFPDEIILPDTNFSKDLASLFKKQGYVTTFVSFDDEQMDRGAARAFMERQFTREKTSFIGAQKALQAACALFYYYVKRNHGDAIDQICEVNHYQSQNYLMLDLATISNLELIKNNLDGTSSSTLFSVLDKATTSMGSRMIKKWITSPLMDILDIKKRQEVIINFMSDILLIQNLENIFKSIADMERIVGRIALHRASFQDYRSLSHALKYVPEILKLMESKRKFQLIDALFNQCIDFHELSNILEKGINDNIESDRVIKDGFDTVLDRLRSLTNESAQKIINLERQEQEKTGINSLKIRYNQVQGYYIEVTKANMARVPDYFNRIQTLAARERFITPALQSLQHEILSARSEIESVEKEIFEKIKKTVASYIHQLRHLAHTLSTIDALISLAKVAASNRYICPKFNIEGNIFIKDGRHAIVEQNIQSFISNDTNLSNSSSLWIITGPNMGGKSTYLRQVALICIMAHIGSLVPATEANIALLDRIFTRIGASDNVAQGKSTFLVEMEETAAICNYATSKSLVILDEVGRGTSTFDGVAIAQAVIEYLALEIHARCLFATHYHELTQLEKNIPTISCYHAKSIESENGIIFLHKILPGIANGSFGLEVAKLAKLPPHIIKRAKEILILLTQMDQNFNVPFDLTVNERYLELERENKRLKAQLESLSLLSLDDLTPRQAMELLWRLKEGK